ncbi:MAG: response regulator [Elusimicrobia bacterium]|nr:response regulator [Elusimicrobiota bacterium]
MAKILIVDDDFEIVALLTEVLELEGHSVDAAYEPVEGMQKARAMVPDLIILDFHMPGTSGAHLFESLRRNQASHLTPILFMSGEAAPEEILSQISDAEHSQFMAKPIHLEDFRKVVRQMLSKGPAETTH